MELFTDAIDEKGFFDPRYTCDIDNSSPELRWKDPPEATAAFALIAEDITEAAPQSAERAARQFAHWVVFGIPPTVRHLPAGIPPQETLPNGIRQGLNGWGKLGYSGPCPPVHSRPHTYVFRLYALGSNPEISHRPTREELLGLISPLVLAVAEARGRYQRTVQIAG